MTQTVIGVAALCFITGVALGAGGMLWLFGGNCADMIRRQSR